MQETGSLMIESGKLGIKDSITNTQQEIEDLIRDSSDKLRSIQMLDKEFRVQHLLENAEKYASDNDISRETAIRDLLYHEELRDTFRKIAERMKRQRSPQLKEVWIKNGDEKIVLDTSKLWKNIFFVEINITYKKQTKHHLHVEKCQNIWENMEIVTSWKGFSWENIRTKLTNVIKQ